MKQIASKQKKIFGNDIAEKKKPPFFEKKLGQYDRKKDEQTSVGDDFIGQKQRDKKLPDVIGKKQSEEQIKKNEAT